MKVKMILPSLTEAGSPFWRPVKYSLFPPLGLATLAGYLSPSDEVTLIDEHVEKINTDDEPDLVVIQVYITNAYRAYRIADIYRQKKVFVALGGLHVTTMPMEAEQHADAIFLGPGEDTFPKFLADFRNKKPLKRYYSTERSLLNAPYPRRDLIKNNLYLVPNSIVVSRGCPHHCNFCYKDSFFAGGKSFYVQRVDRILAEIESLSGRYLYFLDDHLFADSKFINMLFEGMKGMKKVFQAAGTVQSVLSGNTVEKAYEAGLRSLFIGFETLSIENMRQSRKFHNAGHQYSGAVKRLHDLNIMINASFVFGFDHDKPEVFKNTVDWAVNQSVTTATFHILTPYPGTLLYEELLSGGRIISHNWDLYDTRHPVFQPKGMTTEELESGYWWAYRSFYSWSNILKSVAGHDQMVQTIRHLAYTVGWKKMEFLWGMIIKSKQIRQMRPVLEKLLKSNKASTGKNIQLDTVMSENNMRIA